MLLVRKFQSSVSDFIGFLDYENSELNSIPDKDIKLLQALARKRASDNERDKLAEHFQKMWLEEKQERHVIEEEISGQYRRYLHQKRAQDRRWHEFRSMQQEAEQQAKREQLLNCIHHKAQKSAELKAEKEDRQLLKLADRSLEEEARILLATERRMRLNVEESLRKRAELYHAERKENHAKQRRHALLKDASKRVAINNALTSWETALQRHQLAKEEATRRATYATLYAQKRARGVRVSRALAQRRARARRLAAITELMRDVIRGK